MSSARRLSHRPGRATFGDLLKEYRKAAGLTQEQLAERAGYSTVYVSMLERGQRLPQPATTAAFVGALGLDASARTALELASQTQTVAQGSGREGALVGRERELEAIARQVQGTGPPILLVAGEPGIGKTSLLREAASYAASIGVPALEGGCLRRGGEEPFTPVLQALQRYIRTQDESRLGEKLAGCAWLVRLLPELAGGPVEPLPNWTIPPEQERRLMDDAVVRFLENTAGSRSTLLVLDDLQWAAADAFDLIRVLVHSTPSVRIVGAYRENEIGPHHPLNTLLADLAHSELVTHLALGPLSDREADELLDQLLEDTQQVGSEQRQEILKRSDGVPFFLVSCARNMHQGQEPIEEIPWNVTQSIRQRVSMLPKQAQELLDRAAVTGRRVPLSLLVGQGEDATLEGLEATRRAGLLEELAGESGVYQFTHDVIREVVEADLGAARRAVLHRQIGEALEKRGGTPEALAFHFARSTDDDKALLYLERAGDAAAAQHANSMAEGYYRELVDRLDRVGRVREAVRAREKLGQVLRAAGRYDRALAIFEEAAREYQRTGDAEAEGRVAAQLGRVHYLKGRPEDGIELLESVRLRLANGSASQALGSLDVALAPLYMARERYRDQLMAAQQAARVARSLGDERLLAEAEVYRGCALNQLGRVEEGRQVLETAAPLAEAARDLASLVHALNDLGFLLEIGGEFARSRNYKLRALDVAERIGDPAAIANMTFRCGQNAYLSGDWTAAREYFERSVATARHIDASPILAYPRFGLGLLALASGDWNAVEQHAQECLTVANRTEDAQVLRAGQTLLAEVELQEGRPEKSRATLEALHPVGQGLDLHSTLPTLAEACLLTGDLAAAQAYLAEGISRSIASHNRVALVDLLRVKARTLIEQGQWNEAFDVLQEGLHLARPMPYPFAVARLLYTEGLRHAAAGSPDARQSLEEALAISTRLGATWQARLAINAIETLHRI